MEFSNKEQTRSWETYRYILSGMSDAPIKCKTTFAKVFLVMKLSVLLFLIGTLQVVAETSYAQQVSLRKNNVTVLEVLQSVRKQTGYFYVCDLEMLKKTEKISINVDKASLKDVLDQCFANQSLTYEIVDKTIIVKRRRGIVTVRESPIPSVGKIPVTPNSLERETTNWGEKIRPEPKPELLVKGSVKDEKGERLPGVNVILKGTQKGTTTDENGNFSLDVENAQAVLVLSFVGYLSQEITVGNASTVDVVLKTDTKALQEVIVVGYGTQSRETITTSVSKLDNRVLENVPYANAASALQGTLPGVRVQTVTGQPGVAPRVIVRGGTSINNPNGAAPLYIVDGVMRNDMNHINSDDIETMQVLKDAASTAIYGARASNGVVIITTKSGKAGRMQVSYNYSMTSSEVGRRYDLLPAGEFIKFFRLGVAALAEKAPSHLTLLTQAGPAGTGNDLTKNTGYTTQYLTAENQHKLNEGWESIQDPLDPSKTIIFQNTDWQSKLYRTGVSHNHALSASGGNDRATYNVGLGYFKNEGTALGTDYTRLSLNTNGELKLKENLKVYSRLIYSKTFQNGGEWTFDRGQGMPPTAKYRFEDGTLSPGVNRRFQSPEYLMNSQINKNTQDNLTLAVGSRWDILPGLSFEPQVSIFTTFGESRTFQKAAYLAGPITFNDTRAATAANSRLIQYQTDGVFSYVKTFREIHNLDTKLGISYYHRERSDLSAAGQGAPSDLIPTLNASGTMVSMTSSESHQALLGYFARVNYNLSEKYLLSLNARYDGASNLGKNNRWGFFPGISAGWNIHKEDFWTSMPDQLSLIKLRGSYGINGNISGLGDYQAQGVYGVGIRYGGNAGIGNTTLANSELQWERSKTVDVGLDLGIFRNRVNLIFDYYRRVTDNLLTSLSLPHSTGFNSILTNLGSLENQGIELELSASVLPASSPFQWNVALNGAKVKNKILTLPDNGVENNRIGGYSLWDPATGTYTWQGGLQQGGRIGDLFAYKQLGIYATDEEAAGAPVDMIMALADKTKYGGDVRWLDADNNNMIDLRDRVNVGNIFPVWTGGFSNYLSYKNFNLAIRMDYTTGHTKYNWSRALMLAQYSSLSAVPKEVLKSWQKQGDVTDIPRYYYTDQSGQRNISRNGDQLDGGNSIFYEKGDYLALREITISYSLPQRITKALRISNLTLHATGNNLHYFTRYKGLSPEDGGQDNGGYPIPRNIIFGARVSF